jgi:hypothetical protein
MRGSCPRETILPAWCGFNGDSWQGGSRCAARQDRRVETRPAWLAQSTVQREILSMTTMIAEIYDALLAAGSPEDKARKAAEAVAGYENRFTTIDQRLARMEGDFNQRFAKIEGEIKLLTWMIGFNLAATIGVFFMLLRH